jgi:signal transduction histidine kinase
VDDLSTCIDFRCIGARLRREAISAPARFPGNSSTEGDLVRKSGVKPNNRKQIGARAKPCGPHGPGEKPGTGEALATLIAPDIEAEALLRSTLDGLSAHIAVLDQAGTIVAVNQTWRAFAQASGFVGVDHGVGWNYLEVCERGAPSSEDAARTAQALRDIIAGVRTEFRMEYPCMSPDGPRWFQLRMTRPGPTMITRIVIAHEDITEVKRAEEQLSRLSARLLALQDEERRAIARELHDTTAQNLLAITLNASRLREPLRQAGAAASRTLSETLALAEQCLQEVRTLSYLLHPPLLDEIGLASALRWLATGFSERSGVVVEVRVDDIGEPLPREVATALFRVAQEALSNIHRHSGSRWARIALYRTTNTVCLEVLDRGKGLKAAKVSRDGDLGSTIGVGISGMRVRLGQLGGQLEINSGRSGTRVTATVPLAPRQRSTPVLGRRKQTSSTNAPEPRARSAERNFDASHPSRGRS